MGINISRKFSKHFLHNKKLYNTLKYDGISTGCVKKG